MNIGFDASRAFTEEATGTENYSLRLLEAMLQIDTENKYFVYTKSDRENRFKEFSHKIKWVKIGLPYLWTQLGLAAHTFIDPIDVLFVPSHTLPVVRRSGLKTVMTVHDLGAEYLPAMHQLKQQLYLKFITNYQLQTASHLIAVSNATKTDLNKKIYIKNSDISVVYEGVNFDNHHLPSTAENDKTLQKFNLIKGKYFLFIGTIQPRKNLSRLIEAFSLFRIESQGHEANYKLVIAGKPGWDYDQIVSAPKDLGIEDLVIFTGRVDDKTLASLYQSAKALVYPSLFEGFGLPILEAFFFSCPVITSNTSSMPEIAGKGAILVNPNQTDGIMRAMQVVVRDHHKRSELVKHGKEQLTHFSWKKAAAETIKVLEKVGNRS